ncbi:hypothetical protein NC797_07520 [Aquibacillus sp. 3ASR75-11]|uniref:Uncharacterized protein n=1 Tax=Terrihalobacillus insolitus TaxID=2950438 RepID=A0A9X3WW00_9BACI|nr:hypothetical protein [Terrihalobacillus insolitus]MDC3424354.1 hypothetical protein [Terrihalobacillus insolitus]
MKKLLIVAGFVVAFGAGSMTGGTVFSYASSNTGTNDTSTNVMDENGMMDSNQSLGMMNMMGDSSGMGMMGSMSGMMNTMSIMDNLMADIFNEAAKTLGVTTDQLQNEIQSGKSLEMIADEQGVKADKLAKELEKVIQKDLKQFEKEGNVITEQQKEMLVSMSDNTEMVLNTTGMFACNESLDESM